MNYEEIKYLILDIESVPDAKLIKMVKYPGEDIDEQTAVKKFQNEILEITDGKSEFIPVTFQYPVSVTVGKVSGDFILHDVVCLDDLSFIAQTRERPGSIADAHHAFQRGDAVRRILA